MSTKNIVTHDVKAGWCSCGEYIQKPKVERKPDAPGKLSFVLPCGCRVKNNQGAAIAGRYAPTKLAADGTRLCRCGRRWKVEKRYVEVL